MKLSSAIGLCPISRKIKFSPLSKRHFDAIGQPPIIFCHCTKFFSNTDTYNKTGPRGGRIKKRLFLIFLDLKKAFDTVYHPLIFSKLLKAGVRGKMFRVIKNLFSSNLAQVLIDGFLSPAFVINRGVLQGSKLGPTLFNLFINDLLDSLNNSNLGVTTGDIQISALGFADDIVLITGCPMKAQGLLNICQTWATTNNMTFNT